MNTIGRREFLGAGAAGVGLSLVRPGSDPDRVERTVYTQADMRDHCAFYLERKQAVNRKLALEKPFEGEHLDYGLSNQARFLLEIIADPDHGEALRRIEVPNQNNVVLINNTLPKWVNALKSRKVKNSSVTEYEDVLARPFRISDPFPSN